VPFLVVDGDGDQRLREGGALRDVGPTILRMLGLERPSEMDGRDLRFA
jgi:2,3-bisphosphoglycerate-independent phosphoglycerate mutase